MYRTLPLAALLILLPPPAARGQEADILFKGGTIHDGTGRPGQVGDVAVAGGKVLACGNLDTVRAKRVIDITGLVICPGFIDLHTHCDKVVRPIYRDNRNYQTQGVTTVVTGNCGGGRADTAAYYADIDRLGTGTNVAHLLPHGSLRRRVMGGSLDRPPTPEEMAAFKALVDLGMRDGAWGISTGLFYAPGSYCKTEEVIDLVKVVGRHGGLYVSHIRSEGKGLLPAITEALRIGERSGCPVHISHFKNADPTDRTKARAACRLVAEARSRGQRVTCDQYPYRASSTSLAAFTIPGWARVGGNKALFRRLQDKVTAKRIKGEMARSLARRGGAERLLISRTRKNPRWNGMTLAAIAAATDRSPVDTILFLQRDASPRAISFGMDMADVLLIMGQDFVATASDGGCARPWQVIRGGFVVPTATRPHPRSYGTFPRRIHRFARAGRGPGLARTIRSATGLPAEILSLTDRGRLRAGLVADILVFDPATFRDQATFVDPHRYSRGVRWLLVNGTPVIAAGRPTGVLAGRALRRRRPPG